MNVTIEHYSDGHIMRISCENDEGELHNPNGPAFQQWDNNGQERRRVYKINGKIHREDGPAMQWWDDKGRETIREYRIDGEELTEREFNNRKNTIEIMAEGKVTRISRESAKALNLL